MFDKMQYVVERKQVAAILRFVRDTFNIKDVNGNLLGCFKRQKRIFGGGEFWIEDTDGIHLGEILEPKIGYTVYDAQNQLRGTIKMEPTKKEGSKWFLPGLILIFLPMAVALFVMIFVVPGTSTSLLITILLIGLGLTIFGLIMFGYLATKGKFGKPRWLIEGPEGQRLAEGNDFYLDKNLEILAPDGGVVARVKGSIISLKPSYRVDISRQGFDPLLILSYTVVMAYRHLETVRSTW